MIQAYSQRLLPPYSGQVQIADAGHARAVTMDGRNWEIQVPLPRQNTPWQEMQPRFARAAVIREGMVTPVALPPQLIPTGLEHQVAELAEFVLDQPLPFPATDHYEYWLLDASDQSPLALIFSCSDSTQMASYPERTEWAALPAAVMQVDLTEEEADYQAFPVNYRLEVLVNQRAGQKPKAKWFHRHAGDSAEFPGCLMTENWADDKEQGLCQRYLARQAPRLLMLHGLAHEVRQRLEQDARKHALEVERYYPLYPEVVDQKLMSAIRVEARLRGSSKPNQR